MPSGFISMIRNIFAIIVGVGLYYLITMPFSHDFLTLSSKVLASDINSKPTTILSGIIFALFFFVSLSLANFIEEGKKNFVIVIVAVGNYCLTLFGFRSAIGEDFFAVLFSIFYQLFFLGLIIAHIFNIRERRKKRKG